MRLKQVLIAQGSPDDRLRSFSQLSPFVSAAHESPISRSLINRRRWYHWRQGWRLLVRNPTTRSTRRRSSGSARTSSGLSPTAGYGGVSHSCPGIARMR